MMTTRPTTRPSQDTALTQRGPGLVQRLAPGQGLAPVTGTVITRAITNLLFPKTQTLVAQGQGLVQRLAPGQGLVSRLKGLFERVKGVGGMTMIGKGKQTNQPNQSSVAGNVNSDSTTTAANAGGGGGGSVQERSRRYLRATVPTNHNHTTTATTNHHGNNNHNLPVPPPPSHGPGLASAPGPGLAPASAPGQSRLPVPPLPPRMSPQETLALASVRRY